MLTLTPNECRVLGVLIEKAQTTPQQYPMTLNAMVVGSNQKNNREPLTNLTEEQVFDALEGLRTKRLANEVMLTGSRVQKYRHVAREGLEITTSELVVLAELFLRGPQTIGELRGRASRMHPLETVEITKNVIDSLMNRPEPFVRELPPASGDRAPRYAQLLCPSLHPLNAPSTAPRFVQPAESASPSHIVDQTLQKRVDQLESEVAQLREAVKKIAQSLGEPLAID